MSDLQKYKDDLLKRHEEVIKYKSPYHDIIMELTSDEEYKSCMKSLSDVIIKKIDEDIGFKDYVIAQAMISSTVQTMLGYLMKNYNLQFMKKKK